MTDVVGLRAAVQHMTDVLPAHDPWPTGVSAEEEDRWMLRAELTAMVTGMAWSVLDGGRPGVPALQEARSLQARFRSVADADETAAIGDVLDRLDG